MWEKMLHKNWFVYILLSFAALSFAGAFHAGKAGIALTTPGVLVCTRFIVALVFLAPLYFRQPREQIVPRREDLPLLIVLGLSGIFLYHYLFFMALIYTSPVNAAVLGAFGPLITSIAAAKWAGESLSPARFGALLLALAGVILNMTRGDITVLTTMRFNPGDLLMLAAVFFMMIYNIGSKKALVRYSPISTIYMFSFVAVLVTLPALVLEFSRVPWHSRELWFAIVYMGIAPSCIGYVLLQVGIKYVGVNKAVPFINLVPVFSIVMSVAMHGAASVSLVQIASCALIITGLWINSKIA